MAKALTVNGVVKLLKKRQGGRTAKALALELGVSEAYLCDVFQGRREPGDKIVSKLGLKRVTHFVIADNPEAA